MKDCTFFYPEILSLNENARKMLKAYEGSSLLLPRNAFVFMDRVEQFLFFRGDKIYWYYEDRRYFKELTYASFSEFLECELKALEEVRARIANSNKENMGPP